VANVLHQSAAVSGRQVTRRRKFFWSLWWFWNFLMAKALKVHLLFQPWRGISTSLGLLFSSIKCTSLIKKKLHIKHTGWFGSFRTELPPACSGLAYKMMRLDNKVVHRVLDLGSEAGNWLNWQSLNLFVGLRMST
jgi:hypothetical protein